MLCMVLVLVNLYDTVRLVLRLTTLKLRLADLQLSWRVRLLLAVPPFKFTWFHPMKQHAHLPM